MKSFKIISTLAFVFLIIFSLSFIISWKFFQQPENKSDSTNLHYSYWASDSFFQRSFDWAAQNNTAVSSPQIMGAVVNHHLLAPHFIASTLLIASAQDYDTIVLISPNHFQVGEQQILTSLNDWQTPYGRLCANAALAEAAGVVADENVFDSEHGIKNIVPFIKNYFPEAKLLPIVLKDYASEASVDGLADKLNQVLPEKTLIIASFDFSHGQTSLVADQHDVESLIVLQSLNYENTAGLDIDSTPGLRLFLKLLQLRGASQFKEVSHSNSAKEMQQPQMTDVTSYITGYFY